VLATPAVHMPKGFGWCGFSFGQAVGMCWLCKVLRRPSVAACQLQLLHWAWKGGMMHAHSMHVGCWLGCSIMWPQDGLHLMLQHLTLQRCKYIIPTCNSIVLAWLEHTFKSFEARVKPEACHRQLLALHAHMGARVTAVLALPHHNELSCRLCFPVLHRSPAVAA
jgi:hypothetical protein